MLCVDNYAANVAAKEYQSFENKDTIENLFLPHAKINKSVFGSWGEERERTKSPG